MRIVVVLPLPFGPRKPKMWPTGTSIEKSWMTRRAPRVLLKPLTLIARGSPATARQLTGAEARVTSTGWPGRSASGRRGLASIR